MSVPWWLPVVFAAALAGAAGAERPRDHQTFRRQVRLRLPAGTGPVRVGAADVDGDRKLDLIVVGGKSGKVLIYRGDGAGGFSSEPRVFDAGPTPGGLAIGDVNGDGKPDVVLTNHEHPRAQVLLADGRGGLVAAPGSPLELDLRPHAHSVAMADLDGDGKPDLAFNDMARGGVLLALGRGDGSFRPAAALVSVGGRRAYHNLAAADFDGDGKSDLVVPLHPDRSVAVLRGSGGGHFAPAPGSPIAIGRTAFYVGVGDLDGDGKPDIAIVTYSGQAVDPSGDGLVVLLNRGGMRFTPAPGSPLTTGRAPTALALGDMDGDGIADLAVNNLAGGDVTLILGGKRLRPAPSSPLTVGREPTIAIADLDGDGRQDLIAGNADDEVRIFLTR